MTPTFFKLSLNVTSLMASLTKPGPVDIVFDVTCEECDVSTQKLTHWVYFRHSKNLWKTMGVS